MNGPPQITTSSAAAQMSAQNLRGMQAAAYANKVRQRFNLHDVPLEVCLLHGEIAEFVTAWRRGRRAQMSEELADVAIFVLGLAALVGVDLHDAVAAKLARNTTRRYTLVDGVPTKQPDPPAAGGGAR